jgi:hypothetical protein
MTIGIVQTSPVIALVMSTSQPPMETTSAVR